MHVLRSLNSVECKQGFCISQGYTEHVQEYVPTLPLLCALAKLEHFTTGIAGDLKNADPSISSGEIVCEAAVGILAWGWRGTAFFPLFYSFQWLSCFN